MRGWLWIATLTVCWMALGGLARAAEPFTNRVLVLCYHDVPLRVENDSHAVDLASFVEQIEYMRTHGFAFVRPDDIEAASAGRKPLPDRAVMLSFDDGYVTFASNVVPVLELYNIPAMLAICSSWIDKGPPADIVAPLMGWPEIQALARHPLITLASHSHDLHHAVPCNPQGNTAHAAVTRIYSKEAGSYETEAAYRARIQKDLNQSRAAFKQRLGLEPYIMVWPYGEYSGIARELAATAGFRMAFRLQNTTAVIDRPMDLDRWIIIGNPSTKDFIEDFRHHTERAALPRAHMRALRVSLDLIYDPDPLRQEEKLGRFLDRIVVLKPSTVFVEAAVDPDYVAEAVYFPNRVLPMRADLLGRVLNQLYIRGFQVFVSMPTLGVRLPDEAMNLRLRVLESQDGARPAVAESTIPRLSPFAPETAELLGRLYEDMAAHARFHGVLFKGDTWLSECEDFQGDALAATRAALGIERLEPGRLAAGQKAVWDELKAKRIEGLTVGLMDAVRKSRPLSVFARMLDGRFVRGDSPSRSATDAVRTLASYDFAVFPITPDQAGGWGGAARLQASVRQVAGQADVLDRTIFWLPARWERGGSWVGASDLVRWTRRMVAAGARHMAYGDDSFVENQPALKDIRMEYSVEAYLFERPAPRRATPQY